MFKRLIILFLVFFEIMGTVCFASDREPSVNALSAVLIDADTGRVLWGKNENEPMAIASTTKIMTAIVALENADLSDVAVVSENAVAAPPVKMHLKKGEEITLEQLLYALLMQSSNDAAVAVAEAVGGSVEGFCAMMNEKAKQLGCRDTEFVTPNGLDKGNHHSTAYDMALIGTYAIKNEDFIRISNTPSIAFSTNKNSYSRTNKNRLLSSYDGAIGIKTGFTGKAGHCFAGAARRDGVTLVSVVLASGWGSAGKSRKWTDTKEILNYGFNNYHKYSIMGKKAKIGVDRAKMTDTVLESEGSLDVLLSEAEKESLVYKLKLPPALTAPVKKGDTVGICEIYSGSFKLGQTYLKASEDIEEHSFTHSLGSIIKDWLKIVC